MNRAAINQAATNQAPMNQPPGPLKSLAALTARLSGWLRPPQEAAGWLDGLPRYLLVFVLIFGMGMILISLIGEQGLIAYFQLKGEAGRLSREVAELSVRRTELAREIRALREDEAYIELLARQRLGLVRPGELIIQLPVREGRP